MSFFTGTPERHERVSTLLPEQQSLFSQLLAAIQGRGAGGAFGDVSDYYRDLLSQDPRAFEEFAAPEMRRFREDIVPGLAEQFAGMGAGALSSGGFQNALGRAGADLSERLAGIRANLRQNAAAGLGGLGSQGLGNFSQDIVTQQASPGFLSQAAPLIGTALGSFAGPIGASIGGLAGNWLSQSSKGKSSPYGGMEKGSTNLKSYPYAMR